MDFSTLTAGDCGDDVSSAAGLDVASSFVSEALQGVPAGAQSMAAPSPGAVPSAGFMSKLNGAVGSVKSSYSNLVQSAGAKINAATGGGSGTFVATWFLPLVVLVVVAVVLYRRKKGGKKSHISL